MASWDCYCALCGGPPWVMLRPEVGSADPEALLLRRARIAKKKRRLAGEPDVHESDDENNARAKELWEEKEISEAEEKRSYDPELITPGNIEWLRMCHCLGLGPKARVYLSPPGYYGDYGVFCIRPNAEDLANLDPNLPGGPRRGFLDVDCYTKRNTFACFPFHTTCYEILARAIFGNPDTTRIDKYAMYMAMQQIQVASGSRQHLGLDYGEIGGMDRTWSSVPGEEYSVHDPRLRPDISRTIQAMLSPQMFAQPSCLPDLSPKVHNDPFTTLPYDIIVMVTPYLSVQDIFSLLQASLPINKLTNSPNFWQWMIRVHILTWFPEIEDLFTSSEALGNDPDFKRVFLWLFSVTKPEFGMKGPFIGIANRRRIWNAIQPLALLYLDKIPGPTPLQEH